MPFEKDENEIGALWAKTSAKGNEFMSGTIDGMDVVCFRNTKKTSEKQPDWRVLKSKPRESRFDTRDDQRKVKQAQDLADDDISF